MNAILTTVEFFHRAWWLILIRGIVSILFGIAAIAWPGPTVAVLILMLGAWFTADGIASMVAATIHRNVDKGWLLLMLEGVIGVIAGIGVFAFPGLTAVVLLYLFAAWSIFTGVLEIIAGIRLRNTEGAWTLIVSGILSIGIGLFAFISPGATALSLLTVLGIFAIAFGVGMIILAWRAKNWLPETTRVV